MNCNFFRALVASFTLAATSLVSPLSAQGSSDDPNHIPGYRIHYGQACGSTFGGPVSLFLDSAPDIGTDLLFRLHNGVGGNTAWLLVGTSPLNIDLNPIGAWGCHLYVDSVVALPKPIQATGIAEFEFTVPNNPAFIGLQLFTQGIAQDPPANAFGFVFTNGVEIGLGGTP